jgi:hypothetical protein
MFSSVLLPLPDGPTKATKEAGSMTRLAPWMARTSTSPAR